METEYLFTFLMDINKEAAEIGKEVESFIYEDPKGAVIRARLFSEEIVKDIFKKEEDQDLTLSTHYERIVYLSQKRIFERNIEQALDIIRKRGNQAVHDPTYQVEILEAIKIFKNMYKLASWYAEAYSSDVTVPDYRDPKPIQKGFARDDVKQWINDALQGKLSQYFKLKSESQEEERLKGDHNKDQLKEIVKKETLTENAAEVDENAQQSKLSLLHKNLPEGRSYLLRELKRLQESSQEAVENAKTFSDFKDYMHVDRKIQEDCFEILKRACASDGPELILLSGSVGDGKSHLLAYFCEKHPEIMNEFKILNDATESFSPNKNAIETLSELLDGFSDQKIDACNDKIILAINLGVLHNFLSHDHDGKTFDKLKQFIEKSGLFTHKVTTKYSIGSFHLVGFNDYQPYELTEKGPRSDFYSEIFRRVFSKDKRNPFYLAYLEDQSRNVRGIIHENFEFLMDEHVQYEIIQLVIQCIVRNKLMISARAFYNFIADLIIPEAYTELSDFDWNDYEKLHQSVPYLLFNRRERSVILKFMSELDPIHLRSKEIDQIIIDLNTLSDWKSIMNQYIENSVARHWLKPLMVQIEVTDYNTFEVSQALIRITYLTNLEFAEKVKSLSYKNYMYYLYAFNKLQKKPIETFYKELIQTIYKWYGSPKNGYVYLNKANERYRIAQELSITPSIEHLIPNEEKNLTSFKQTITVVFQGPNKEQKAQLEIDYPLYELLTNVKEGYCPNKKDEDDAIQFVEFLEQIMKYGKQSEEVLVHIPADNKQYVLKKGFFGGYVFEKEHG